MTEIAEQNANAAPVEDRISGGATILVCLPSISSEALFTLANNLKSAFPGSNIVIASCNQPSDSVDGSGRVQMVEYPGQPGHSGWVLSAADYLTAANLALQHKAAATLLLGPEVATLSREALLNLGAAALEGGSDLVLPRYRTGPHEALVSAALLYPLSRALFGIDIHMPLPLDVAFSARMASRFAVAAKRPSSMPGSEALLWPVAEAALASFVVNEIDAGHRTLPQPGVDDLNALLAQIAGSLFADIESKAAFWQRARSIPPNRVGAAPKSDPNMTGEIGEIRQMAADFRNAYNNLQEIWSLVLPPQSLLALKKLALSSPEAFMMPANLWARNVYDFVLAFRLRTINRGHLLGAFTPLYLAWVASHLRIGDNDPLRAGQHIEETAAAFVAEKPYVVSRWRWPDRFNP